MEVHETSHGPPHADIGPPSSGVPAHLAAPEGGGDCGAQNDIDEKADLADEALLKLAAAKVIIPWPTDGIELHG